ncbi:MAG TPA: carboxyl transferase domain-containing protein [Alphaproteobacteria bacterium]|jgi:acetyl-CoA carboxylase carboxyltransferase component|nr:carboxyl transferase domain-containing protein [Alphaproteobacteria bacterium]MDP6268903.1 carboxyl transferase domain-containing protein [Alphaproteobacteria bacterium]MDP7164080.1 carboxyl transferase domain-containing protein [Alphaproteobacteria bacterium]MDP7427511.1 carboxyl transferase domain-containing protein [Alphaproteobacteria bacterium]HJM49172.1 carboxyl transferase domain-containing protein [Alphaproteobacteria bacterium]
MRKLLDELARRHEDSLLLGGERRIERQRKQGKLTARERVDALFEPGSFEELGQLASHVHTPVPKTADKRTPADGVITGFGRAGGRTVGVVSEDFTVLGGSVGLNNLIKKNRMVELAGRDKLPLVWLFDGAGARTDESIGEGLAPMHHFMAIAKLSGIVPQACAVMGPVAGDSALIAAMIEFIVMVRGTGMLAAGGPPLVYSALGHTVDKEELGGSDVHCRVSGVADNVAEDDLDAIAQIKRFLSYLPQNAYQYPPDISPEDDPDRREEELLDLIPENRRRPYDMYRAIELIVDRQSYFDIKPDFARMMITGLARLNGHAIGVIANQPRVQAGAITAAAGTKQRHFMDLCNAFHLPIVSFMDTPGVMTGPQSEREGALRAGMAIAHSFAFARVPLLTVALHKGIGYGACAMGGYGAGQSTVLAWPTADFNAIPLESGIQAAYRADLEAAADPAALRAELEAAFGELCGAFPAAEQMKIDDIIDPRNTRPRLIAALERALNRRHAPAEVALRHGIMP